VKFKKTRGIRVYVYMPTVYAPEPFDRANHLPTVREFVREALDIARIKLRCRDLARGLAHLADAGAALAGAGRKFSAALLQEAAEYGQILEEEVLAADYSPGEWEVATRTWVQTVAGDLPGEWDRMEGLRVLLADDLGDSPEVEAAHAALDHAQCMVHTLPLAERLERRSRCRAGLKDRAQLFYSAELRPWWELLVYEEELKKSS
jgi:hypothetical protein